jgi:hypothetical protein
MTEIALEKRYSTAQQALDALELKQAKPSAPSKLPIVRKIPQPAGTYIKLYKSAEKLKISLPAPGLRNLTRLGCLGIFCFLGATSTLLVLGRAILLGIFTGGSLFTAGVGLAFFTALSMPLLVFLAAFFGQRTHIYFDRNFFEIERELLSFRYGLKRINLTNILGVLLQKEGSTYQINLRLYYGNYPIGGALGENESAWLAQEIQDWLNSAEPKG